MDKLITFIDSEISKENKNILDLGALNNNGEFHSVNKKEFASFIANSDYLCGHNIVRFDQKYVGNLFNENKQQILIDTLFLSPLLFPKRPYHRLVKDDKLQVDDVNNPLADCIKARDLFNEEVNAFLHLPETMKTIFCSLLHNFPEFTGFFKYIDFPTSNFDVSLIKSTFKSKICSNADIPTLVREFPIELAYALAIINCDDRCSITPSWVTRNFPNIVYVMKCLRHTHCSECCEYCNSKLDITSQLKTFFGYSSFREYEGEPLQEQATQAAVNGKSLIAVFPTGGGKSLTFQLPALIAGETIQGLTVVISPLQSLMKDQVDKLERSGKADAVMINGLLDPIQRAKNIELVDNGTASILYISPEQLRSKSIEKLLLSRNVVRFVIDEAHCFSSWGQDFRVDYLYIGDFIKQLQEQKNLTTSIPVSCFTATAKRKVITDICDYFRNKLNIELECFATSATRQNLRYSVIYLETQEKKYDKLRELIETRSCPTIVYVARVNTAKKLAKKLRRDGFQAKPFYGGMDSNEKIDIQDDFINNRIQVIIATSAFGMGVDKEDVQLVVHYDISSSIEDYVQESGRAGRKAELNAECFILYNVNDLDKHFGLLKQTKLSFDEIQQVWRAIKELTKKQSKITRSSLEIARAAGWNENGYDIETRVTTAISTIENAGYIRRGHNVPHIYATSIQPKNMEEARKMIDDSTAFGNKERENAHRIIKFLITKRSVATAQNSEAESRVDYIADNLGITKAEVISAIDTMRSVGILEDSKDMSAYISESSSNEKLLGHLHKFADLEKFILNQIDPSINKYNLKELNDKAIRNGISNSTIKDIKTIIYYWVINGYISKSSKNSDKYITISLKHNLDKTITEVNKRISISELIISDLYAKTKENNDDYKNGEVQFSLVGLFNGCKNAQQLKQYNITLKDISNALLYLSKISIINIQGGFLVLYNGMEIERLEKDNKAKFEGKDYEGLKEYYKQKVRQIHIVGEYANIMINNPKAAVEFIHDYFQMDFEEFLSKYFNEEQIESMERNITPKKYSELFDHLSPTQKAIIEDDSQYMVVAAGPGSGKTRVLVTKLASILLLEENRAEQLLMITFSRAAVTEFQKRLLESIGSAAYYVDIKTFHSFCFDLMGQIGSLEESENVIKSAISKIKNGEVEKSKITKSIIVIDEAQDMDIDQFNLIRALIEHNDDMRLIAVGDDDQTIYGFKGSSSVFFNSFITEYGAKKYEMVDNYRCKSDIVKLSNYFVKKIPNRMKEQDCLAVNKESGTVKLVHHTSNYMEEPIVNDIINRKSSGTICVLTATNEEAAIVTSMLNERDCQAKLIQSIGNVNYYNLIEIRSFLNTIRSESKELINDSIWSLAKDRLIKEYENSSFLEDCLALISEFEVTSKPNSRNYRDVEEFFREYKYKSLYQPEQGKVVVSTIHKAKGQEFDNVYMLLNITDISKDDTMRQIYVGLTRAKSELVIHYNNDIFTNSPFEIIEDNTEYELSDEIIMPLSHSDVVLNYFKDKKNIISKLSIGDRLYKLNDYLVVNWNGDMQYVAKLSANMSGKLNSKYSHYEIVDITVNCILYWKGKDDNNETLMFFPKIHMKRNA